MRLDMSLDIVLLGQEVMLKTKKYTRACKKTTTSDDYLCCSSCRSGSY